MDKITHHIDIINEINNKINYLLNENTEPTYEDVKIIKYIVIENDADVPQSSPNDPVYYMYLDEAKQFEPNAKVGDEIEVESIEWNDEIAEDVKESIAKNGEGDSPFSLKQLKGLSALGASPANRRTAGKVGRYAVFGVPRTVGKLLTPYKQLKKLLNKELPHSICWCANLFEEFAEPTLGDIPHKPNYMVDIAGLTKQVQKGFEKKWDQCDKDFMNKLKTKKRRHKALINCKDMESWTEKAEDVLSKIISALGSYYVVKGHEKKSEKGQKSSVAEKISQFNHITIYFTNPASGVHINIENLSGTVTKPWQGGSVDFKVSGIHKEGDEGKTVILKKGGKNYIFSFATAKKGKSQSGQIWYTSGGVKHTKATAWVGQIEKLET